MREWDKVSGYEEKNTEESANKRKYVFPPVSLLDNSTIDMDYHSKDDVEKAARLESIMAQYGAKIKVLNVYSGLRVTRYEFLPIDGTRIEDVVSLKEDVELYYCGRKIRIERQVSGKAAMAFEICDGDFDLLRLKNVIEDDEYESSESNTRFAVGMGLDRNLVYSDLNELGNLLVTGYTGSGKSTFMQAFILNLLYKANPDELKFALIDTKIVEYSRFNALPHLVQKPINSLDKAFSFLESLVDEIEIRNKLFAENGVRSIGQYNLLMKSKYTSVLPEIVLIIDEIADLIMLDKTRFEDIIIKLLQRGRHAGIYVVLSTQMNSRNINREIMRLIRVNGNGKIRFSTGSNDELSEDSLMGLGDMLFKSDSWMNVRRLQGLYVDNEEITRVVDYITSHNVYE